MLKYATIILVVCAIALVQSPTFGQCTVTTAQQFQDALDDIAANGDESDCWVDNPGTENDYNHIIVPETAEITLPAQVNG